MRLGYIVTKKSDDALFDPAVRRSIKEYVLAVSDAGRKQHGSAIREMDFSITQIQRLNRTTQSFIKRHFVADALLNTRVIYIEDPIKEGIINSYFSKASLIVSLRTHSSSEIIFSSLSRLVPSCSVTCERDNVKKLIEDIFLDISFGDFVRREQPFSQLVEMEGLASLFRRKVAFVRKNYPNKIRVSKGCRYVSFSSLTDRDPSPANRAAKLLGIWQEFSSHISNESQLRAKRSLSVAEPSTALSSIPRIGKQLPLRRISKAISSRENGIYKLVVLLKGFRARKSPDIRGDVKAVFGSRPQRMRSFVLVEEQSFSPISTVLASLHQKEIVGVYRIRVESGRAVLASEGT